MQTPERSHVYLKLGTLCFLSVIIIAGSSPIPLPVTLACRYTSQTRTRTRRGEASKLLPLCAARPKVMRMCVRSSLRWDATFGSSDSPCEASRLNLNLTNDGDNARTKIPTWSCAWAVSLCCYDCDTVGLTCAIIALPRLHIFPLFIL